MTHLLYYTYLLISLISFQVQQGLVAVEAGQLVTVEVTQLMAVLMVMVVHGYWNGIHQHFLMLTHWILT